MLKVTYTECALQMIRLTQITMTGSVAHHTYGLNGLRECPIHTRIDMYTESVHSLGAMYSV